MKIAYQGIPGCNSEEASELFATNQGFANPEYIPAVNSAGVTEMLRNGEADYGVMATHNLMAGEVTESRDALKTLNYRTLDAQWISIHHSLFVKREGVKIEKIASHVQAFGQCRKNLKKKYPGVELIETEHTALAEHAVDQCRLAMIYMGDYCYIANVFSFYYTHRITS